FYRASPVANTPAVKPTEAVKPSIIIEEFYHLDGDSDNEYSFYFFDDWTVDLDYGSETLTYTYYFENDSVVIVTPSGDTDKLFIVSPYQLTSLYGETFICNAD
ncbi:MAG: hypothetical protein LBC65_00485, partial [Oscillospiraceae bacterium]|nr:hypothetical protein [Oscillospiraceae bacterium]